MVFKVNFIDAWFVVNKQGTGGRMLFICNRMCCLALVTIQGTSVLCPVTRVRSIASIDTRRLPPGVYTLRVGKKAVKTMLLLK